MIGRSVRSVYFLRDMKIIEYDDVVNCVYFVDYGGVESRVQIGTMCQAVRLPRGRLVGICTKSENHGIDDAVAP